MNAIVATSDTAQTSEDSKVLMLIVQKMSDDPDFDIDKVKQMIEIKERLDATAARKAYAADMAEFKKIAPIILKDAKVCFPNKDGSKTEYDHASLGNVVETAISKLADFGFSHRWTAPREGDRIVVTCTLTHRLGHSESETQDGAPDASGGKSNLQAAASTRTFLERYTFLAVTGLATKAQGDDDGRAAGGFANQQGQNADDEIANPLFDKISISESVAELQKLKPDITAAKVADHTRRSLISSYNTKRKQLTEQQVAQS